MANSSPPRKIETWSWYLYDWANSGFTTLILTFVFGTYFSQAVARDPVTGAAYWGYAISFSGFLMLFLGPVCGAFADNTGKLKRWLFLSTWLCGTGVLLMLPGVPHAGFWAVVMVLTGLVVANTGFELSSVFYNALLPNVSRPEHLGETSSFGWAVGYVGGLVCLSLMLVLFIGLGKIAPFIALPKEQAWHIRVAVPLVVVWLSVFATPLFVFVRDRDPTFEKGQVLHKSWLSLKKGFASIKSDKTWRNFLIGSALYRDGLNTLFAMGGIYAAQAYQLQTSDILLFGIGMNVTAGIGAYIASLIEDRVGSFNLVKISLAGLMLAGMCILFVAGKEMFFISALSLGLFVGPVQSASRTIVSRISGHDVITENYGFYALTGRAAAFLGPFFYAVATEIFKTQTAGIASIILFWLTGFIFIFRLRDRT